jgi:hypothetical protein
MWRLQLRWSHGTQRIYAHHSSNAVSFFIPRKITIFILINLASVAFVCCWNVHDRKKFSEVIIAVNQRWDTEMYWSHKIILLLFVYDTSKYDQICLLYFDIFFIILMNVIESSLEQSGITVSCLQMVCSRCRFSLAGSI